MEDLYKKCFYDHFERLYAYAFTIVKNNGEAKDIVQTSFLRLWEKRNGINFQSSAKAYLYKTVYHLSVNTLRDKKTREAHHDRIAGRKDPPEPNPAENREARLRIHQAIEELPPRCREVFVKSRFEGKKYAEIAIETGISVKTVEVHLGKALRMLRDKLSDLAPVLICFLI